MTFSLNLDQQVRPVGKEQIIPKHLARLLASSDLMEVVQVQLTDKTGVVGVLKILLQNFRLEHFNFFY